LENNKNMKNTGCVGFFLCPTATNSSFHGCNLSNSSNVLSKAEDAIENLNPKFLLILKIDLCFQY
jgi:hypothetical protein